MNFLNFVIPFICLGLVALISWFCATAVANYNWIKVIKKSIIIVNGTKHIGMLDNIKLDIKFYQKPNTITMEFEIDEKRS